MIDHCFSPDTSGDGSGCDNMTVIIVEFQLETPEEEKSTVNASAVKAKASGKRSTLSSPDLDTSHQSKKTRLEEETVQ